MHKTAIATIVDKIIFYEVSTYIAHGLGSMVRNGACRPVEGRHASLTEFKEGSSPRAMKMDHLMLES